MSNNNLRNTDDLMIQVDQITDRFKIRFLQLIEDGIAEYGNVIAKVAARWVRQRISDFLSA